MGFFPSAYGGQLDLTSLDATHLVPHHRQRAYPVLGVVVHSMAERVLADGIALDAATFLRRSKEIAGEAYSAHALVAPDGKLIRCVSDALAAFHAGRSVLHGVGTLPDRIEGYPGLNDWTLGVEFLLEGTWAYPEFLKATRGGEATFTPAQYDAGGALLAAWMHRYRLSWPWVAPHSFVASDLVRGAGKGKVDPGPGFDWARLIARAVKHGAPPYVNPFSRSPGDTDA